MAKVHNNPRSKSQIYGLHLNLEIQTFVRRSRGRQIPLRRPNLFLAFTNIEASTPRGVSPWESPGCRINLPRYEKIAQLRTEAPPSTRELCMPTNLPRYEPKPSLPGSPNVDKPAPCT